MNRFTVLYLLVSAIPNLVNAQSNTNSDCEAAAYGPFDTTIYYNPTDIDDIGVFVTSEGTCDSGSIAGVTLFGPTNTYNCDDLALDGNSHLINCQNIPRGTAEEGSYYLQVDLGTGLVGDSFQVTHSQSTITAAQATSTVTVYPTVVQNITTSITKTVTYTSAQATVTSSGVATTNTITVTPKGTLTTTTTSITTLNITKKIFTMSTTTITSIARCTKMAVHHLSAATPIAAGPAKQPHIRRRHILKRLNNGEGLVGDGPLTTTLTPAASLTTTTGSTTTTTVTITTTAPDASTTISNPSRTVTIITGTAASIITTTLPQKTVIRTANALTIKTITSTSTLVGTVTIKTTPACSPTN